jgi:hypothetical protein
MFYSSCADEDIFPAAEQGVQLIASPWSRQAPFSLFLSMILRDTPHECHHIPFFNARGISRLGLSCQ